VHLLGACFWTVDVRRASPVAGLHQMQVGFGVVCSLVDLNCRAEASYDDLRTDQGVHRAQSAQPNDQQVRLEPRPVRIVPWGVVEDADTRLVNQQWLPFIFVSGCLMCPQVAIGPQSAYTAAYSGAF
jgi:hypothetical protein